MTPTCRPAASADRRLAHGVGLGLLAGGVVLGVQGAALALVFVLQEEDGSDLRIRFTSDDLVNFDPPTATVTGSFSLDGTDVTIVDPIVLTFDDPDNQQFNTTWDTDDFGFFETQAGDTRIVFSENANAADGKNLCDDSAEDAPCILFRFDELLANADEGDFVSLGTGQGPDSQVNLGAVGNFNNLNGSFECATDGVNCGARAVPSPFSALALLPLGAIAAMRKRYKSLSGRDRPL